MKISIPLNFVIALAVSSVCIRADVKLPVIISDHMVLQKSAKVPIWGKADPGERVLVRLNGQTANATAGADGKWMTTLNLEASPPGPFEMTVEGTNKLLVSDVVVGEVWLASGQSNMEWGLNNALNGAEEIAASANPLLRQFRLKKMASIDPVDDCEGAWVAASPSTSAAFTAVGYYFGKTIQNTLGVPVGLINSSWGGTPSEAWTSAEALDSVPELKEARERWATRAREFPEQKKAFIEGFGAWLKANNREDNPTLNPEAFAAVDLPTEGWIPVQIPGIVAATRLPKSGAVWLRKEVVLPSKPRDPLPLTIPLDGYDSVYWNGKLIKQTTHLEILDPGNVRRGEKYSVPPEEIRVGKNVLAIRLFDPMGSAKFTGDPKAGALSLAGEWQGKSEYEFPMLTEVQRASAPKPPLNPAVPQNTATTLFNGMIRPLIPYAIAGVIWYQGESNAGRAYQYRTAFPLLITDWRTQWNQGEFPFYFCQLANWKAKTSQPGESIWSELREAQLFALKLPSTGQAVLIDVGESDDIHPRNKKDPGERLAAIALSKTYNKLLPFSGPVYESMKIENGKAILSFKHTEAGLVAKPLPENYDVVTATQKKAPLVRCSPKSELEGFSICGEDRKWVWADASIQGNSVVVWSDKVPSPFAVRYAWADNPTCNLVNSAGLPASPFRTDDFPLSTANSKY